MPPPLVALKLLARLVVLPSSARLRGREQDGPSMLVTPLLLLQPELMEFWRMRLSPLVVRGARGLPRSLLRVPLLWMSSQASLRPLRRGLQSQ